MLKLPIYLDHNATTPMDPRVLETMIPYFTENFGNAASRNHSFGWHAEEAVDYAREQIAQLIGADPKEIIFTSGATEGDNLGIKGVYEMYASKGNHIITCTTEHKAVLDTCKHLEKLGAEVTYLEVQPDGLIDLKTLEAAMRPTTILVAIMYANNEIGVIQPVKEISAIAKKHGALYFSDAVQAVGKIPVHTHGIHLMAFSAHKLYGPKGVGALYIRHNHPLPKPMAQIHGGGHEKGFRSGTLNVPSIVGFGKAASLRKQSMESEALRLGILRDSLESQLLTLPGVRRNGSLDNRLSHVSNLAFDGVEGEELLQRVNLKVAVSSGSACSSISPKPSHVLQAMGLPADLGRASIRFSLGKSTRAESIEHAVSWVRSVIEQLRQT